MSFEFFHLEFFSKCPISKPELVASVSETIRQTIALQSEIGSTMVTGRLVGGLVLVHLAREDPVAANKSFHELEGKSTVND